MYIKRCLLAIGLVLFGLNAQAIETNQVQQVLVNPFTFYLNIYDAENGQPLQVTSVTTLIKYQPIAEIELEDGSTATQQSITEVGTSLYQVTAESTAGLYKVLIDRSTWQGNSGGQFQFNFVSSGNCEFPFLVTTAATTSGSTTGVPAAGAAGSCKSNGTYVSGTSSPSGGSVTSRNWDSDSNGNTNAANTQTHVNAVGDILSAFGIDPATLCSDANHQCQSPQKCLPEGIVNPSSDGVDLSIMSAPYSPGVPSAGAYHHYVATVTNPTKGSSFKASSCGCHNP